MSFTNSKYFNIIRLLLNERRSLDELIHHQNIALRKLVKHAYGTVPFYKRLFDECKLHPSDIQSIEDISKLPFIDKQLLAKNSYDKLISKKYNLSNLITVKTAGSNGTPYMFYIDHSFDQFRKAQFLRPYFTNGRRPWDHLILFSVHNTPARKWFQHFGLMLEDRVYLGTDLNEQIRIIQNVKPAIIQGYGSVLNLLSAKIIEENISMPKPRLIFTDSELLMPDMRENIEKAFSTKVIDVYGTWETDNIAYECSQHEGYHIAMDCVIMEFIKDGKPVNPDEEGEIVVTVLNNFAMPFIRYNMHDIGSYNEQLCLCGRTFPLMSQINGRANDYMITEDGRRLSFFTIAHFNVLAPHVYEYQIIQEEVNLFNVYIVPSNSYTDEGRNFFVPVIKKIFPHATININIVPAIKRDMSGKFRAFKSNVKNV